MGEQLWGDYDNDGDLDIFLTGNTDIYHDNYISKIYRNDRRILNLPPTVPYNLKTSVNGNNITFSWDKSTDEETIQNGLTYNLVIGTNPGIGNILSPMSDRSTGYRRIVNFGNTGHCYSLTIKNLTGGQYYWSVQAMDNNFEGSQFAPEHIVFTNCSLDIHPDNYELSSLIEGNKYYVDRNYTLITVPDAYKGFNMIKTANDDKIKTNLDFNFNLCSSSDVYIAYDHLISIPSWITNHFIDTGDKIYVSDENLGYFDVWKRATQPGIITFGDNEGDINNSSMYFVFYNPVAANLKLKVFLQGPYTSSGSMTTTLQSSGLIPPTSPYNDIGNNSQFYNSSTCKVMVPYSIPSGITDWVQVEIRSSTTQVVESQKLLFTL